MAYEAPANVMISAADIQRRVKELADEIQRDYAADDQLHLVSVLKGGFIFLGDLVRAMHRPVTIDFMAVSSYAKGMTSSGEVRVLAAVFAYMPGHRLNIAFARKV